MKAIKNYLLKIDDSYDSIFKKRFKSLEYILPETMEFDKGVFPQIGEVISVPNKNPLKLSVGSKVLCSHRVNENKIKDSTYYVDPFTSPIFAELTDDGFNMKNNYVMVERVSEEMTSSSGIIINAVEKKSLKEYIVKHTQEGSQLKEGMKIRTDDFKPYSFKIRDTTYYMLNEKTTVMAYIENDTHYPVNEWVMVKPKSMDATEVVNGVIQPTFIKNTLPMGVIHKVPKIKIPREASGFDIQLKPGLNVGYIPKGSRVVEENGEKYLFVRQDLRDRYDEIRFIKTTDSIKNEKKESNIR